MLKKRFVFDTNVLVSALLVAESLPALALHHAETTGTVLYSEESSAELFSVLTRPKLARYIDQEDIEIIIEKMYQAWEKVPILRRITACRDPHDDMFLELAVSGQADALVTGDADLLVLNPFLGVNIVMPGVFLKVG
jgi:putative PIN family toxin of toxin-antitoxin system